MENRGTRWTLIIILGALLGCSAPPGPPEDQSLKQAPKPGSQPPVPMDVLGIAVGEPLKLPRCANKDGFDTKTTCWRNNFRGEEQLQTIPSEAVLDVYFADSDLPSGIFGSADVIVSAGKVSDVSLTTMDFAQEGIYKMLEAKWGKPYQANIADLQNGFGARYRSIEAHWLFPKLRILFLGQATIDSGSITFQSLPPPKSTGPEPPTSL